MAPTSAQASQPTVPAKDSEDAQLEFIVDQYLAKHHPNASASSKPQAPIYGPVPVSSKPDMSYLLEDANEDVKAYFKGLF